MRTLSFDLRGFGTDPSFLPDSGSRSAGASLLIHGTGLSALVLLPLLGASPAPEPVNGARDVLVEPVRISLPPPPRVASAAPRGSNRARATAPSQVDLTAPKDVPVLVDIGDVLDSGPVAPSDGRSTGDPEGTSVRGGDCALGALCGAGVSIEIAKPVEVVRIGGLIREPRLIEGRPPQYPPIAQAAGVAGKVVLEAHVAQNGRVLDLRIVEGHTLFNEAALASVRSRRYEPLLLNGVPTDFLITITVAFTLRR